MMLRMKREFAGTLAPTLPVFDTLLLLDRNVDLLTPLATQLTYEGLIDEIYGITNGKIFKGLFHFEWNLIIKINKSLFCYSKGYVKLPPEKFAQKKQGEGSKDLPTEPKKLQLNSAEELYAEIRDKNFNAVGAALSKKAKIISAAFEVCDCSERRIRGTGCWLFKLMRRQHKEPLANILQTIADCSLKTPFIIIHFFPFL